MYNFVKLSDAPEVEDGATHVLGVADGKVCRIPAGNLGGGVLMLELDMGTVTPMSADAEPRAGNGAGPDLIVNGITYHNFNSSGGVYYYADADLYGLVCAHAQKGGTFAISTVSGGELLGIYSSVGCVFESHGNINAVFISYMEGPGLEKGCMVILSGEPQEEV